MESSPRPQLNPTPPPLFPYSTATTSPKPPQPPPVSPRPITRSEPDSPFPTTFVQADPSNFKQVVQMLTGSSPNPPQSRPIPPIKTAIPKKPQTQPGFRLYERRNSLKKLSLKPLVPSLTGPAGFSPRKQADIPSPSLLDFPSLSLSPVTPLMPDPFAHPPAAPLDMEAEERAIKEKGFFLHPSPRGSSATTPEPRLLPLFPITSPRVSSGSD